MTVNDVGLTVMSSLVSFSHPHIHGRAKLIRTTYNEMKRMGTVGGK